MINPYWSPFIYFSFRVPPFLVRSVSECHGLKRVSSLCYFHLRFKPLILRKGLLSSKSPVSFSFMGFTPSLTLLLSLCPTYVEHQNSRNRLYTPSLQLLFTSFKFQCPLKEDYFTLELDDSLSLSPLPTSTSSLLTTFVQGSFVFPARVTLGPPLPRGVTTPRRHPPTFNPLK